MNLTEMEQAIGEAKATLARCDMVANELARLLVGRLKSVNSSWVLKDLKNELRGYNIHTGRWSK